MQVFSKNDYNSFKTLVQMDQDRLHRALNRLLKKMYPKESVVMEKEYTYAIGDIPICLVAHMDTVFSQPPQDIFYDRESNVVWSPDGLGADDRAGVFAILKILSKGYRPHVIFTTDEELGCIGALQLAKKKCPFKECHFIIQLDRAHKDDCVFYSCYNPDFEEFIQSYGFEYDTGTFTDITQLCPFWGIAGVNLSVGYYNEHSLIETLYVSYLFKTIDKVVNILKDAKNGKTKFYRYETFSKLEYMCSSCHKVFPHYMMIPTVVSRSHIEYLCPDCATDKEVSWCQMCGEAYIPDETCEGYHELCPKCIAQIREEQEEKKFMADCVEEFKNEERFMSKYGKSSKKNNRMESRLYPKWDVPLDDYDDMV